MDQKHGSKRPLVANSEFCCNIVEYRRCRQLCSEERALLVQPRFCQSGDILTERKIALEWLQQAEPCQAVGSYLLHLKQSGRHKLGSAIDMCLRQEDVGKIIFGKCPQTM